VQAGGWHCTWGRVSEELEGDTSMGTLQVQWDPNKKGDDIFGKQVFLDPWDNNSSTVSAI